MSDPALELQEYEHVTLTITDDRTVQVSDYAEVRVWSKAGIFQALYFTKYWDHKP